MPKALKTISDVIKVAESPPGTQDTNAIVADCSAKSQITTRTPPQGTVLPEPPQEGKSTSDATVFAPSKIMPRTPPPPKTRPNLPPEGPSKPPRKPKRAPTPFDTEDDELSDHNEADDSLSLKTIPNAAKSTTETLNEAVNMLRGMHTSGRNLTIRDAVVGMLEETIQQLGKEEKQSTYTSQHKTSEHDSITNIVNDIREIKTTISQALTANPRTWAQIAASAKRQETSSQSSSDAAKRNRLAKARSERAKTEVAVTTRNASDRAKNQLEGMKEEEIARGLQSAIDKVGMTAIKLQSVKRTSKHILKIRCATDNDADQIRKLDWNKAIEGATVIEPEYGIVVNGASKRDINPATQTQEEITARIEATNNIKVSRTALLRSQNE